MDWLKLGMDYEKSDSIIKRTLAQGVLMAEKKYADLYEAYVNKQGIHLSENSEEDADMLKRILKECSVSEL